MVGTEARGAFTLLEIVIVLAILAMASALVPPTVFRREGSESSSVTDSIVGLSASARALAVRELRPVTLTLELKSGRWWMHRGAAELDRGGWRPDAVEWLVDSTRVVLVFTPEGGVWGAAPLRVVEAGDTVRILGHRWSGSFAPE